jgi:hypothetical protein
MRHAGAMRTPTIALTLAAAALALTACSSSGTTAAAQPSTQASSALSSPQPSAPAPSSAAPKMDPARAALETAVRAYSTAYFKPDPDAAYALLSKRCAGAVSQAVYAAVVKGAAKDYGQQAIKTLTVDQLSGSMARVSYTYAVPKLDQNGQPWVREGGSWRYDAC